jgi:hypothetical protein
LLHVHFFATEKPFRRVEGGVERGGGGGKEEGSKWKKIDCDHHTGINT